MPRRQKNIVTTEAWPTLREGRLYRARIRSAAPDKAASALRVTLENLEPTQVGRIHELKLPLPLRPGNRVCAFLTACGIDATTVGTTVDLDPLDGVIVGMRFRGLDANGAEEFEFEKVAAPPATAKDAAAQSPPEKAHRTEFDFRGGNDDSQ
jgi:hypothetical protein